MNKTQIESFFVSVVVALDDGMTSHPRESVTFTILGTLCFVSMCLLLMVCRGVPEAPCDGRCTYLPREARAPRGLEPASMQEELQEEEDHALYDETALEIEDLPRCSYSPGAASTR